MHVPVCMLTTRVWQDKLYFIKKLVPNPTPVKQVGGGGYQVG